MPARSSAPFHTLPLICGAAPNSTGHECTSGRIRVRIRPLAPRYGCIPRAGNSEHTARRHRRSAPSPESVIGAPPAQRACRRLGSCSTGSRTSISRKWRSETTHLEDEKQREAQPPNESRCKSPKHKGTIAFSIVNRFTDPGVRINTVRHLKNARRRLVSLSGEGLHSRGL